MYHEHFDALARLVAEGTGLGSGRCALGTDADCLWWFPGEPSYRNRCSHTCYRIDCPR